MAIDRFIDHDTGKQFRIIRIPTDGNCLFHCMARALAWQDYHSIKSDILRCLPTFIHKHDPDHRLQGDYLQYVRDILTTAGAWGDQEQSRMFAERHHATVVIHPLNDNKTLVGNGERTFRFLWRNQSHYDYLEEIPDSDRRPGGNVEPQAKRRRTAEHKQPD